MLLRLAPMKAINARKRTVPDYLGLSCVEMDDLLPAVNIVRHLTNSEHL